MREMLILSAAFDVSDHPILIRRLEFAFGISGSALDWIKSYLSEMTQKVHRIYFREWFSSKLWGSKMICLEISAVCHLSKPIGEICRNNNVLHHCYADDTQTYLVFKLDEVWQNSASCIVICMEEIEMWISVHMLKSNQDKTELIVFSSKRTVHDSPSYHLKFGDTVVSEAQSAKKLCVWFNKTLCMQKQI